MSRQVLTAVAVLMVVAASNAALAGGCGGGKSSGHYGGVNVHHRFVATHSHYRKPVHTHVVSRPVVVVERPVVVQRPVVDHCHHPKFCLAYVNPGETLLDICGREYGNPGFWTKVSQFNGLPTSAPLVAGQPIKLPTIYDSGRMVASDSPVPPMPALGPSGFNPNGPGPQAGFNPGMPQGQPQLQVQQASQQMPMMQGQMQRGPMNQGQMQQAPMNQGPQMNMREAERVVPTFTAGSQLVLDGQQFGGTPGRVLMAMGPMELPVAVANWTPNEVVVQLPELPLTIVTNARLIVLDADNKLVTQSELQLAPKTSRLAMGN